MDRIQAICTLIEPCGVLADIGCDHGLVSLYAVEKGVKKVIASDISEGSLQKARELLAGYDGVRFCVSDGFDSVDERVDTAVISGMGGRKILDIISRLSYRPTLILGAQHNVHELREYLCENGWMIEKDFCFFDRGKYYDFIRAVPGKSETPTTVQLDFGIFYKQKNEHLLSFLLDQKRKIKDYKQTESNLQRLALIEEVLKWQL